MIIVAFLLFWSVCARIIDARRMTTCFLTQK